MTREIWIKPEDGQPDRFDALPATIGPGSMIHVLPGTYGTRGQWLIPAGATLRGYGDARIEATDDRIAGNQVLLGLGGSNTLENLTVDGKWSKIANQIGAAEPRKLDCVVLSGSHNRITNVRVKGFGGTWEAGQEAFGLLMATRDALDNVIRNCFADGSEGGNYQNGIACCSLGTIQGCTAENMILKTPGHASGIGLQSGTMSGNTIRNCVWGTYVEGASYLTIIGNHYLTCWKRGIRAWLGSEGLTISSNLIEMQGVEPDSVAIEADEKDGKPVTTTQIANNRLVGVGSGILLKGESGRGQNVSGNFLDERMKANTLARDAVCLGNRTLNGAVIASLPDRKGKWK